MNIHGSVNPRENIRLRSTLIRNNAEPSHHMSVSSGQGHEVQSQMINDVYIKNPLGYQEPKYRQLNKSISHQGASQSVKNIKQSLGGQPMLPDLIYT